MTKRGSWMAVALSALALGGGWLAPERAEAFCGFYVAGTDASLHNEATTVVLMREGTRTVLSMQNDYAGPPEDFAMVVPVPVVLRRDDVRTLERDLFARLERMTGPRLVEYWERDPCAPETIGLGNLGTIGFGSGAGSGSGYGSGGSGSFVRVEARFAVGEYDVVILGSNDSSALDAWLRDHGYRIPAGAAEALRPYVESGMKFFVARVDVDRVRFEGGRAVLSPLRVHYESEQLSLPVRLGLLNSSGTQDLVVLTLARHQRYELANYPNVFVPTNLDVSNDVRERFGDFYGALLDRTLERHPGAVVTEYAWQATSCDPCPPDTVIDAQALTSLGGDVLYRDGIQPGGSWAFSSRGTSPPRIELLAPTVDRGLSPDMVRRIHRRHLSELRYCYEQSLALQPSSAGVAEATVRVDASGAVTEATVVSVDGNLAAQTITCMQSAVRRWTYPAPEGGAPIAITQRVRLTGPTPPSPAPETGSASSLVAYASDFVVTRLHYRYGTQGLGEDLVFRAAEAVVGGREETDASGRLEEGARPSGVNNFQARYVIRHPWEGPVACANPRRGIWGGPPGSTESGFGGIRLAASVTPTVAPAHGPRGTLALEPAVLTPVAALGLPGRDAAADAPAAPPVAPAPAPGAAPAPTAAPTPGTAPAEARGGGFCAASSKSTSRVGLAATLAALVLALARRAKRS